MIVVFDLETTGVKPAEDRIVQIAAVKVDESFVEKERLVMKINPGVAIPEDAIKVHGITNDDVKDCRLFVDVVDEILSFLKGCDLAGYNILGFDIPLFAAECRRAGSEFSLEGRRLLDAMVIFRKFVKRDLASAYRIYCQEELVGAHDALADTLATTAIIEAQMMVHKDHPEMPLKSIDDYANVTKGDRIDIDGRFVWDKEGNPCFSFGKLKGMSLAQAKTHEYGYLQWMLGGDFSDEVKDIIRKALKGEYPQKEKKDEPGTDRDCSDEEDGDS